MDLSAEQSHLTAAVTSLTESLKPVIIGTFPALRASGLKPHERLFVIVDDHPLSQHVAHELFPGYVPAPGKGVGVFHADFREFAATYGSALVRMYGTDVDLDVRPNEVPVWTFYRGTPYLYRLTIVVGGGRMPA